MKQRKQRPLVHDIIVIGASAGGVEPLKCLISGLPADLLASVFIVLHIGASSYLADILDRAGPLPVKQAKSGEQIRPGHAYVAAPGAHLLLHDGHVMLRRGPRENFARPAIDPLFEQMLWGLLRSHRERAAVAHRLAEQERKNRRNKLAAQLLERAQEYEADAELVQRLLVGCQAAPDDQGQA
jgi:chemotaxis response regulator CheB